MTKFSKKIGQKWIFHKNWAPSHFSIYSPLTSSKKSEKTNESILRRTLNKQTKEQTNTGEIIGPIQWSR